MSASMSFALPIVKFLVVSKEAKSLAEISRYVGVSNGTAFRIMVSLKNAEWVSQDPVTKKYCVGIGLLELALSLVSSLDLRVASLPYLEMLSKKINDGVMLTARVGLERVYVEQLQSGHELRYVVQLGARFPLWAGAPGKVIFAYLQADETKKVFDRLKTAECPVLPCGNAIDSERLREELAEIRRQGYAVSSGERIIGATAVAAPIFDRDRKVVGAISVGGPETRFTIDDAVRCAPLVMQAAQEISGQLGYHPDADRVLG